MTVETEKQGIRGTGPTLCDETPSLKLLQHSRSISRGKPEHTNLWIMGVGMFYPGSFIGEFFVKADWTRGRNVLRLIHLRFGGVEGRVGKSGKIGFCCGFAEGNGVASRVICVTTHV